MFDRLFPQPKKTRAHCQHMPQSGYVEEYVIREIQPVLTTYVTDHVYRHVHTFPQTTSHQQCPPIYCHQHLTAPSKNKWPRF
ncbi:CotD family spore coat protein [Bacillus sp. FSL W7-1360]